MKIEEFKLKIEEARANHPIWFDLEADSKPTNNDILQCEEKLNIKLPKDYLDFLKEFGGGTFAFTNIYSLDNSSNLNLVNINNTYCELRNHYLLISDNGVGDFYGVDYTTYESSPLIYFFDHETSKWSLTNYECILDFIYKTAMRISES